MDAIFEDMMGDEGAHQKQAVPVNSVGLQNVVVNPRFEGGPHIKVKVFPHVPVTSQKELSLVNFSETVAIVANVHELL